MNKYQREGVSEIQYSNSADGAFLIAQAPGLGSRSKKGITRAKKVVQVKGNAFWPNFLLLRLLGGVYSLSCRSRGSKRGGIRWRWTCVHLT